jgi:hypothetical protein
MKLAIFGASGLARETLDIALISGYTKIIFIDKSKEGRVSGFPVVTEKEVYSLRQADYQYIIGIGNPKIRKEIRDKFHDLNYANLIHPSATFGFEQIEKVKRKTGNIICAGARMTNQNG